MLRRESKGMIDTAYRKEWQFSNPELKAVDLLPKRRKKEKGIWYLCDEQNMRGGEWRRAGWTCDIYKRSHTLYSMAQHTTAVPTR